MDITYKVVTWEDQLNLVERIKQKAGMVEGEFLYFLKRFNPREAGPAFKVGDEEWIATAGTYKVYKYASASESARDGWELD